MFDDILLVIGVGVLQFLLFFLVLGQQLIQYKICVELLTSRAELL
jgi:hypothetical protein